MRYKNPPPTTRRFHLSTPVRTGVAAVVACFIADPALSCSMGASGATVASGTACLTQNGSVTTVTNSNGAIIKWPTLSVPVSTTLHFQQPSASSTVLNEVLKDPTLIYGTLSSNGRVWLVNPAGIMVGPGGRVDTAGFVASTLRVNYDDFAAGRHRFLADGDARNVVNQGEIRTPAGGSVYLIGSNVANEGIITTPGGETILAAGATVSLIDSATPGVKVDITGSAGDATNLGQITAEAGRVGIAGVIVRNSGQINASSVVSEGGRVFLRASQDAYVDGNGRIVTTGTRGGSVEVLGNRVAVTDRAEIDASGSNGGGRIMVGGDWQGKNPEVRNASISYFGPEARLKADATGIGDGGTVIVWADDTTRAYGSISARGGAAGGDGGFVETSGRRYLDATGIRVNVGADKGERGAWLLDPSQINIVAAGATDTAYAGGVFSYGGDVGVVLASDVSNALGFGNVVIHTDGAGNGNGNISANGVSISGSGGLTLAAYGGYSATGNISITGSNINVNGGFKALAGWNGATSYLGSDVIAGKGDISISGSMVQSASNVDLHAGNDITLGHTGTSGAGTWIQSNGVMSVSARNLSLFGGSGGIFNISGSQGPGVMLRGNGGQTIEIENQILLQAGSANNTAYAGSPMFGGSVAIESGGYQDISANIIKVYAGASGHDNGAQIQAYGNQSITITGSGGLLKLKGGGDGSTSVYGGAGSFNNQARIQHGQTSNGDVYSGTGGQTLTVYGAGTVFVLAGSGTGVLGYYGSECVSAGATVAACRGSSNGANIENGVGAQTLAFVASGSLAVTGGNAGSQNWAAIGNKGVGQFITGNPNITLSGGSGGGTAVLGGTGEVVSHLSNDAGIFSKGTGVQDINAGTLTIYGGSATWGGAGISGESGQPLNIHATGNLKMYGGSSSAGEPFASAAYIGSDAGSQITVDVGGDIYIKSGSTVGGAVMIGSIDSAANVSISNAVGRDIALVADVGMVGIGSQKSGSGASVTINSGRDLSTSGSGSVMIGSETDSLSATTVTLKARRDISLGGSTLVGVEDPSGAWGGAIRLVAGWDGVDIAAALPHASAGYGSVIAGGASFRSGGGTFSAYGSDNITLGSVNTDGVSGDDAGGVFIKAYNGTLDVNTISARGGAVTNSRWNGGDGGNVSLQSGGKLTLGSGGINAGGGGGGDGGEGSSGGSNGGAGGQVAITSLAGEVKLNGAVSSRGGDGGDGSNTYYGYIGKGGLGGNVTVNAGTNITVMGSILTSGGDGGDFSHSSNGGDGGDGGRVEMTSGGLLSVSGNITANGGFGGTGGTGNESTAPSGGWAYGNTGGQGGDGGSGGDIILTSTAGDVSVSNNVTLSVRGGTGGQGGVGGVGRAYGFSGAYGVSNGHGRGGSGGQGGDGGGNGSINLSAVTGGIVIGNSASLLAKGGTGGQGGVGGAGYAFGASSEYGAAIGDARGGQGGRGGAGGIGGEIVMLGGSDHIVIYGGAQLLARGGQGGAGGAGGSAFVDGALQSGFSGSAGSGGDGGNFGLSTGRISLTSYGDIVFSGVLDTRGGAGGSGEYGGNAAMGGNITMTAGSDGFGGTTAYGSIIGSSDTSYTGGGSFTAKAGDSITLGSVNTDGVSRLSGYSGGNVTMTAAYGSLVVGSISAKGGDSIGESFLGHNGGAGGNVSLQSYDGLTLGVGGINATGGKGSGGWDGGEGGSAGSGGQGGSVTLSSLFGDLVLNGGISAKGGAGRDDEGYGSKYANGGHGGTVKLTAYGGGITGGSIDTSGGFGGSGLDGGEGGGASGGTGGNAGSITLSALGGNIDYSAGGVVIVANGGHGGYSAGGNGGYGGAANTITLGAPVGSLLLGNAKLSANGGDGGNSDYADGGNARAGGTVLLRAYGGGIVMSNGSIDALGGHGGSTPHGYAGTAGVGGTIGLETNGSISLTGSVLAARGGFGGLGWGPALTSIGMAGGYGGQIALRSTSLGDIALSGTSLDVRGGDGGGSRDWGYKGGSGGAGGSARATTANGSIALSNGSLIIADGGMGGTGAMDDFANSRPAAAGGDGGKGGAAELWAHGSLGGISLSGSSITARGGQGGSGGAGNQAIGGYGMGAAGGKGGHAGGVINNGGVILNAAGGIKFSDESAVFLNGGAGGSGGTGVYGGGPAGAIGYGGRVQLFSAYGGTAGGVAIVADVVGSDWISAQVSGAASYGGISVRNFGEQPSHISVIDAAMSQASLSFSNSGNLTLDGTQVFTAGAYGSTQIESDGILNVTGTIGGYDVKLGGSTVSVDGLVTAGNNIELAASTIDINATGLVSAGNNVALIALVAPLTGGTINLMGGVTADGMAATPSSISTSTGASASYKGIAFVAGDLFADAGGYLHATDTAIGNISGLIFGDITLKNGANFEAGKDIDLVMTGPTSTLSLLGGAYMLASPTTIKIDFTTRASGGIVVGPGSSMDPPPIIKRSGAPIAPADICVTNPLACKTATDDESKAPVIDLPKTDTSKPLLDPTKTTGGTEGTFGGDSESKKDEGSTTAGLSRDEGSKGDKKDDKKDEKDKDKDKKSDEAKDEKKDEKPAQKKVAQCT